MYLNWIGLGFVGIVGLYFGWQAFKFFTRVVPSAPTRTGLLVAQDTGKSKHNQSKNGDASMNTELQRRRTVQMVGRSKPESIKETVYQKGSTTGAIETFFLLSVCPPIAQLFENLIYDAGFADDDFCDILNDIGSGPTYDSGRANNTACDINAPRMAYYDAGTAGDDFPDMLDKNGSYDGGTARHPYYWAPPEVEETSYDAGGAADDYDYTLPDTGKSYDAGRGNTRVYRQ